MNIYAHFASHTRLPVRLADVKEHILDTGIVSKIVRIPVTLEHYIIHGGYHLFRDITPYSSGEIIARIGYPSKASEGLQRLILVKEMLHILDPHDATSPTKDKVEQLVKDLLVQEAGKAIGMPAMVDHSGLLHALTILLPASSLDELRPAYKKGKVTIEQIADEARIPPAFVNFAMRDEWLRVANAA